MKKIVFFLLLVFVCSLAWTQPGYAEEQPIRLYLDSVQLEPEVPPVIINGITLVPVRIITENLGAEVDWDEATRKVTVKRGDLTIEMTIDQPDVTVNGETVRLETAPTLMGDRTMLPVRFISEQMGIKVIWDGLTRSVSLFRPIEPPVAVSPSNEETETPQDGNANEQPGADVGQAPGGKVPDEVISGLLPDESELEGTADEAIFQLLAIDGDMILIYTGAEVKPKLMELSNPDRLVIDLPDTWVGKTVNGMPAVQNGVLDVTHPAIRSVRYAQFSHDPATVRVVIDWDTKLGYRLLETSHPGVIAIWIGKPQYQYKVVLDAGHGGSDPGALSFSKRLEKDFNLSLTLKVAELLQADPNIQVVLTRQGDETLSLEERVKIANASNADLFVSIHANYVDNPSTSGTETYYYNDHSKNLADIMHKHLLQATGFLDRKVRKERFYVIRYTTMPAILCEVGFISNPEQEQLMYDDAWQEQVAASIVAGIKDYLYKGREVKQDAD